MWGNRHCVNVGGTMVNPHACVFITCFPRIQPRDGYQPDWSHYHPCSTATSLETQEVASTSHPESSWVRWPWVIFALVGLRVSSTYPASPSILLKDTEGNTHLSEHMLHIYNIWTWNVRALDAQTRRVVLECPLYTGSSLAPQHPKFLAVPTSFARGLMVLSNSYYRHIPLRQSFTMCGTHCKHSI